MKKILSLIICLLSLLYLCVLSAASEGTTSDYVFTDDLGRTVSISSAKRVATLIGSFADIWCLSGGKDYLVATANDTWTSFNLELDENVVNLGAVNSPNLEALLSANPDFIIASCNTQADIDLLPILDSAHIPVAYFDIQDYDDYIHMLDICTMITGERDCFSKYGLEVINEIQHSISRQDDSHPSVLCIRATGSSCKIKNSSNLLGKMLADMGCINIADSDDSLLESLSLEKIMVCDPEYIFIVLQGADSSRAESVLKSTLLSNPVWESLSAVKNEKLFILDNSLFNLKPNSNWGKAYEILADILYP